MNQKRSIITLCAIAIVLGAVLTALFFDNGTLKVLFMIFVAYALFFLALAAAIVIVMVFIWKMSRLIKGARAKTMEQ